MTYHTKGEKITGLEDDVRRLTDPTLNLDQRSEERDRINNKYSRALAESNGTRSAVGFDADDCTITLNVYNNGSVSFSMRIKNAPNYASETVGQTNITRHSLDDLWEEDPNQ